MNYFYQENHCFCSLETIRDYEIIKPMVVSQMETDKSNKEQVGIILTSTTPHTLRHSMYVTVFVAGMLGCNVWDYPCLSMHGWRT